jgi:hypothetical protein
MVWQKPYVKAYFLLIRYTSILIFTYDNFLIYYYYKLIKNIHNLKQESLTLTNDRVLNLSLAMAGVYTEIP